MASWILLASDDTPEDTRTLIKKILNLRLFDDDPVVTDEGIQTAKSWRQSVKDIDAEVLCGMFKHFVFTRRLMVCGFMFMLLPRLVVSQFTLMARTDKGSKPGKSAVYHHSHCD